MLVLVTGGARSGKSRFAEEIVRKIDGTITYVATAIPFDEEMKDRIQKHQAARPSNWNTHEGYLGLEKLFAKEQLKIDGMLLDCVTLWVTNLLFHFAGEEEIDSMSPQRINEVEAMIVSEVNRFIKAAQSSETKVVIVTNEIGMGIVPENKLSRVFRDIQGRINQLLGSNCDEVYLVVCSVPMKIKG